MFFPGTKVCDRETPRLTSGDLIAAAKSSSALGKKRKRIVNFAELHSSEIRSKPVS